MNAELTSETPTPKTPPQMTLPSVEKIAEALHAMADTTQGGGYAQLRLEFNVFHHDASGTKEFSARATVYTSALGFTEPQPTIEGAFAAVEQGAKAMRQRAEELECEAKKLRAVAEVCEHNTFPKGRWS